jgi:methyl-accepting chemotaxis protein
MSVLDRITAPIVLPQRLLEGVDAMVEALAELPSFERAVLERLDSMDSRLETMATNMEAVRDSAADLAGSGHELVGAMARIEARVEDPIAVDLHSVREQLDKLTARIDGLAERLPDPSAPGPIAKAREAITGDH